jgi:nitroimidazol reductase NimA-like FMN-containing flavoprotein (pyridoxamine 5'-phosphate oxidase superfamily)
MMASKSEAPSERTRAKRLNEYARYDRETLHAILDAAPYCHVGYVLGGAPVVTPTIHWREGDEVFWHGSSASRMIRKSEGVEVCLTVTLLDGLVLARSGFNHSVNYRSAMLFGRTEAVEDRHEKLRVLEYFMERILPGRWATLRPPSEQELKATKILKMPIVEASAKVTEGMPKDEPEDYDWPVWAGVVPIVSEVKAPHADPRNLPGIAMPDYVKKYRLGGA